jgi:hypothetical protein
MADAECNMGTFEQMRFDSFEKEARPNNYNKRNNDMNNCHSKYNET